MIRVNDLWIAELMHGELTLSDGADVESLIKRAIRRFNVPYPIRDIQYCIRPRGDGTNLVYFELLD